MALFNFTTFLVFLLIVTIVIAFFVFQKMRSTKKGEVSEKNSVKARPPQQKNAATQRFLPIAEIHNNTVVLKNGGIRSVLQASSVNFNLKSEEEQNALIIGYQSFLNSLEFPVQILIRSKKLDIDNYLASLTEMKEKQANPLLKNQTAEYQEYIEKLVEYADIMEKKFYVIIPADDPTGKTIGFIDRFLSHIFPDDTISKFRLRKRHFLELRKKLTQRVNQVEQALMSLNIRTNELSTKDLIELFYQSYNPITAREEKIDQLGKMTIEDYQEEKK